MHHIQRRAILTAALALIVSPVVAAPKLVPPGAPAFAIPVQGYRGNGPSIPGLGAFWGGGVGFGGGRYNNWPTPAPQPTYQPPVYNTYQPPPQQQAPVVSDTPSYDTPTPAVRKTTFARPVPNAQPNYLATLSAVRGDDVSVRPAGGTFANISSGRQLKASDELSSGPDTEVTLTLRDGSTVRVSPATRIGLAPLDKAWTNTKASVNLSIGKVSADVSLGATTGYNFSVKTDRAMVAVREADFTVRHDKKAGVTAVSVESGVVLVTPTNTSLEPITLQTGQRAEVTADHINASPVPQESAESDAPATTAPASTTAPAVIPASASEPITTAVSTGVAKDSGADAAPAPATVFSAASAAAPAPAAAPAATDLTGSWMTQDGRVVQLTQTGNRVSWNYGGSPGHESLTGTVSGTFDGKSLDGTFEYKEGATVGSGTMTLSMDGSDRLVGKWASTSPPGASGETILTRQ